MHKMMQFECVELDSQRTSDSVTKNLVGLMPVPGDRKSQHVEEFKAGEVKWEASCSWTAVKSMGLEKMTQREKVKSEKEGCLRSVDNPDIYGA